MHTEDLTAEAARLLGAYIKGGRHNTDLLKAAAAAVVDLRASFVLDDGRVDWSGRSTPYRAAIHDVYAKARVPAEHRDTIQAALRYHVGNLLRDRVPADDLGLVGLTPVSPRSRLSRQREVVAALSETGSVAEVLNDPVRLLAHADVLLDYVRPEAVEALTGADRVAARRALESLLKAAERLRPLVAVRQRRAASSV